MVWCDSQMHVWGTGITKMAGNWAYVSPDEEKIICVEQCLFSSAS